MLQEFEYNLGAQSKNAVINWLTSYLKQFHQAEDTAF